MVIIMFIIEAMSVSRIYLQILVMKSEYKLIALLNVIFKVLVVILPSVLFWQISYM